MQVIEAKFNEEDISKILVELAERFAIDDYAFVKYLKHTSKTGTLDVVILLDRKQEVIDHLYDALNYRMGESKKIPTFFRSQDKQSFMFPGGVNFHFVDRQKFDRNYQKWTIVGGICESKYASFFLTLAQWMDSRVSWVLVLTDNPYYNFEKEHSDFWRKAPTPKTYDL